MGKQVSDLNTLEQAALAATQGHWRAQHPHAGSFGWEVANDTGICRICDDLTESDAAYIAAANPAVVLELVRRLRAAEQAVQAVQAKVNEVSIHLL